jgi:hypothetical protein
MHIQVTESRLSRGPHRPDLTGAHAMKDTELAESDQSALIHSIEADHRVCQFHNAVVNPRRTFYATSIVMRAAALSKTVLHIVL